MGALLSIVSVRHLIELLPPNLLDWVRCWREEQKAACQKFSITLVKHGRTPPQIKNIHGLCAGTLLECG